MSDLRVHVVRPGDCIESIAAEAGCAWDALWDAPENGALRARRASPNLLVPGDVVRIPERLARRTLAIHSGGVRRFRGTIPSTTLHVRLLGDDARPVAGIPYRLIAGATVVEGTTSAEGEVEAEVPATARRAWIELSPGTDDAHVVDLEIGHLDPIDDGSGVAQRLRNLGFLGRGAPEGTTADAVAAFQRAHGLGGGGALNDETLAKLLEVHDG